MAALAVLPVHAIYAGFVLRESLVVLTSILAVWTLTEVWQRGRRRASVLGPGRAGRASAAGLAILARTTALALVAAAGAGTSCSDRGRRQPIALLLWMGAIAVDDPPVGAGHLPRIWSPVLLVHVLFRIQLLLDRPPLREGEHARLAVLHGGQRAEIVRVKVKSLLIIVIYSTMIVGLPIVAGFVGRLRGEGRPGRETDLLVATIALVFVLATLKSVADVTQVAQLGRYYVPVFVLMLPTAVAGLIEWLGRASDPAGGRALVGGRVRRDDLGRPDLGLRRLLAHQAVPAPLAGDPRGRRLDPAQSRRPCRRTPGS